MRPLPPTSPGLTAVEIPAPGAGVLRWLSTRLPQGTQLDAASYRTRLHVVRIGLLLTTTTVAVVGLLQDNSTAHLAVELLPIIACLVASWRVRDRMIATACVTVGLALAAALLVHLTDGLIEAHFAFFVVLPLIALFHDWRAIVGAALIVLVHHTIAGTLTPAQVYNHPAAQANPVLWGAIHVAFVACLVVVLFVHWNYSQADQCATRLALAEVTRSQDELVVASNRFRSLVQNAFDAVILVDDDRTISYIGGAFDAVFGWNADDLLGRDAAALLELMHPDDAARVQRGIAALLERMHPDDAAQVQSSIGGLVVDIDVQFAEVRFRHPDGSFIWIELVARPLLADDDDSGLVINARDITKAKLANDLLAYRAAHDELTGLPNRALLVERLDRALASRTHGSVGLIFLDIDRFKNVNDSMGHNVGDQLLIQIARNLESILRDRHTVARLGGDEFVILVDGVSTPGSLCALGEQVSACLEGPFVIGDIQLSTSASIGVALGTVGDDATRLLRNADGAMYQAKQAGRNQIAVFDEALRAKTDRRLVIESELRVSNLDREMLLHYQPVVDLQTGELFGVEALVRWQHPTRGLLMPGEFITIAEETGLILRLGEWVLREACRQAVEWERQYGIEIHMALNVSARQLGQPGFAEVVHRAIHDTGIAPDRLMLEVTESVLVDDPVMADANLTDLRQLGVGAALDDYGTGYASLSYLRTLPLTHIKIDRSFTNGLGTSSEATAIVENTVSLARGLGLIVVAEGIETPEQYDILCDFRCDLAQGYHLGRPMLPTDLEAHPLFETKLARDHTIVRTGL